MVVLLQENLFNNDISMLATEIGEEWWVGKEDLDNGLMMLYAIDDRKRFIAVGYGLEWALPDSIVRRIGEHNYHEVFREWD